MIRASAKNFPDVIVIVDPADYPLVLEKIRKGGLNMNERKRLAQKVFQHVAVYDTAIAQYRARVIDDKKKTNHQNHTRNQNSR
jgi:phosphoribosylaminoimidazolecarboxamide formyltransferase/IMP cyclohydrolase